MACALAESLNRESPAAFGPTSLCQYQSLRFPMKPIVLKSAGGLLLLGAVASSSAQSTWNYLLSNAGGGNSRLTWSVTGDLASPPGSAWTISGGRSSSLIPLEVHAAGIFADSYLADGTPQSISTPDGSYFQLDQSQVYQPIASYAASNASGSGEDSFGLVSQLFFGQTGIPLLYHPGTQSVVLPIDFSAFNPGIYQSLESGFSSPLVVTLTVASIPEPSTTACIMLGVLMLARPRKPSA